MDMEVGLETKENVSSKELRALLLYGFCLGRKATKAARNTYSAMDEDRLSMRTAQHWLN